MAQASSIEWTETTWNPVTGCTKISSGCKFCYAERMARRLNAMGNARYERGFRVTLHDDLIEAPLRWRRPRQVFVNSMSDLFHESVPIRFIQSVFETMVAAKQHTFQILTKRPERAQGLSGSLPWPANVWMGTSVENQKAANRVAHLQRVPAMTRFLSCEPLIGPLERLSLDGIHWVIVGGESGPGARPMKEEWVDSILKQSRAADVPFFFKQWGGVNKKKTGRKLHNQHFDEFPSSEPALA